MEIFNGKQLQQPPLVLKHFLQYTSQPLHENENKQNNPRYGKAQNVTVLKAREKTERASV